MNVQKIQGQTLIEAVVATALVTLVLAALVSAITYSLANAQFARNKAIATKYAQEAVEFLRIERDADWWAFYDLSDPAGVYCLVDTTSGLGGLTGSPPCTAVNDNYDIFARQVALTGINDDSVTIKVTVDWLQGDRSFNVVLDTNLTRWK